MNQFDVLVFANLILAVVALYQLRICTLILVGNNLLVARALGLMADYGQPTAYTFLPPSVFSPENLSTAAAILTISLISVVAFTIASMRQRIRIGPNAPAVPKPVMVMVYVFFLVSIGSTETIVSTGYANAISNPRYEFNLAGASALFCGLFLYELARRRLLALITARRAFLTTFVVFFFFAYLKGATGITTGYLLTAAFLYLPRTGSAKRINNVLRVGGIIAGVLVMSFIVRNVREGFSDGGWDAVTRSFETAIAGEETREESSIGVESTANATQSAAHMLLCITLFDAGISREWRSIYDVIEYTFRPSLFEGWFGWKRSIDARWELAEYFSHGGGINVLGELYWNGGWLCVLIMSTMISFFAFVVDKKYRASPFWLMMMAQFAPSFLMGYGYGFAQIARGAINCLLVAGSYWIFSKVRDGGHATTPLQPKATTATLIHNQEAPHFS